jgi:branched-chain amino acid transport system ATP-binding protein
MSSSFRSALEVRDITVRFGSLLALDSVSLSVSKGEIFGLIGPNGSGKTTLVNVMTGFQRPTNGAVVLSGRDITKVKPASRASVGLARTFQAVRLFGRMTVLENIELGALAIGCPPRQAKARASQLIETMNLHDVASLAARSLPYGIERRVAIARALASEPSFLLLDEPAAGLDEDETDQLSSILMSVRESSGCGLLVIEHDMRLITEICDRVHVLASGRTLAEDTPEAVISNPAVVEAYLGTEHVDGDN